MPAPSAGSRIVGIGALITRLAVPFIFTAFIAANLAPSNLLLFTPFDILFAAFVVVAFGNAVNLTDGLDGLAIMPTVLVASITPSCASTIFLAIALAPLHAAFGIERVFVTTMQAVSGAGYPGVPSLDILGNVIPDIPEEGAKMEREVPKILGSTRGGAVVPAPFTISAMTYRVAVEDGQPEQAPFMLR